MPLLGQQGESYETELWERRIKAIRSEYRNFVENEIPHLIIPGKYSAYLKRIVSDLYYKIESSLQSPRQPCLSSDISRILSATTSYNLSFAWHTVLDLSQNTASTPEDLIFFMDSIYERLGGEEVPYFIKLTLTDLVPGTIDICRYVLKPFFINLRDAFNFLANKKAYIIFATPSLMKNPIDWALLIHEAAHILEEEHLRIVASYYPQLELEQYLGGQNLGPTSSFEVEEAMPSWALEIACDMIATISCGPIFGYRILSNYFGKERGLHETHPPIKKRLELISDELERNGWEQEANDMRARIQQVRMPELIENATLPEHCPAIINDIREETESRGIIYRCTAGARERIRSLGERLNGLKPCLSIQEQAVDLRDLLNAAIHVNEQVSETVEFRDFLADMIRLITARDIYRKHESSITHQPS